MSDIKTTETVKTDINQALITGRIEINTKQAPIVSRQNYVDFIKSFAEQGLPEDEKLRVNKRTKNLIAPKDRLKEQGILLLENIKNPENSPKLEKGSDNSALQKYLLDAAFKIQTENAPNALHVALDSASQNEDTKKHTNKLIKTIVEQATDKQLAEQDRNGKTALLKAVEKEQFRWDLSQTSIELPSKGSDHFKHVGKHISETYKPSQTIKTMIEKSTPEQLAIPSKSSGNVLDIAVKHKMDEIIPLLTAKMNTPDLKEHVRNERENLQPVNQVVSAELRKRVRQQAAVKNSTQTEVPETVSGKNKTI